MSLKPRLIYTCRDFSHYLVFFWLYHQALLTPLSLNLHALWFLLAGHLFIHTVIHSLTHSLTEHSLSVWSMPGLVAGVEEPIQRASSLHSRSSHLRGSKEEKCNPAMCQDCGNYHFVPLPSSSTPNSLTQSLLSQFPSMARKYQKYLKR